MTPPTTPVGVTGRGSLRAVQRVFHAIDIENLVGSGHPDQGSVATLRSAYTQVVAMTPLDQTVVACNPASLVDVARGWGPSEARYRVGFGRDGADWELLAVLELEGVADRFHRVVVASGDGIFASTVARLASVGCEVTVVSRRASLSAKLRLAATRVIYLPDSEVSRIRVSNLPKGVADRSRRWSDQRYGVADLSGRRCG